MKTPIQELIETFEEMRSPIDSKVDVEFAISLMKSMLEKEEYTMGLLLNFILKRYSTDFDISLRGYCFIDANGVEVTISEILEHFYNETFNTKER